MADDNKARNRFSDPLGRGPESFGATNDPLAELARLIGQHDPFAGFGRDARQQPQQEPREQRFDDPNQPYGSVEPMPYEQQQGQGFSPEPQQHDPEELPRFLRRQHGYDDRPGAPSPTNYHPSQSTDPSDLQGQQFPPEFDVADNSAYSEPQSYAAPDYGQSPPQLDPPSFLTRHARNGFDQREQPIYPAASETGAMPAPHDDEFYDEAPRADRRKGLLTVAAVFALAVVGTTGAVGYRSFFSGPGSSGPPPVIRASSEPSKVPPPPVEADPSSAGKFTYDRFADRGKDEQVIKREETPIDAKELARTAPRTVFPPPPGMNSPSARPGTTATANPPSAIGEPRRVRTVPIRPDQADMAASSPSVSPDTLSPSPSRQASAGLVNRPMEIRPENPAPAAPPMRAVPTRPSGNAPLSLSPDSTSPPAARDASPPAGPERQAAVSPPPRASSSGRFHVQVSSQKSEADAEQSFRSIQSKYSSVLGAQPHTIRRADLGSKGVYYRAMVGPYASREEAVQLCLSLKSAGGDCVVQAN